MALIWCDSFDYATGTADLLLKGYTINASYNSISNTQSRWSGKNSLRCTNGAGPYMSPSVLHQTLDFWAGFAWWVDLADPPNALYNSLVHLNLGSSLGKDFVVKVNESNYLELWSQVSTGSQLRAISAQGPVDGWNYVEFYYCYVDGSSNDRGVVRLNGVNVIDYTGRLYQGGGTTTTQILFFGAYGTTYYFQDFYYLDGNAGLTGFLGDIRVQALRPDGAGNYSQWTPSAGSNYQNVDDDATSGIDEDTTYNESSTTGNKDSFTLADMSGTKKIYGVVLNTVGRKTDATSRGLRDFARLGSTDYLGDKYGVPTDYGLHQTIFENNPADDQRFEVTDINAMESGYELVEFTTTTTTV
jgi:hypothetical protein